MREIGAFEGKEGQRGAQRHGRGVCGVKDQGSQNGTFINGEDLGLGGAKDLNSGDILKIGKSTFKVFLLDRKEAAETWKSVWGEQ